MFYFRFLYCYCNFSYTHNAGNAQDGNGDNAANAHNTNGENAGNPRDANGENTAGAQNANVENAGNAQNGNGEDAGNLAEDDDRNTKNETPILIAAKMGVTEVVNKILDEIPVASFDINSDHKNAVLLAAENKRVEVYKLLMKKQLKERMFAQLDCQGKHLDMKVSDTDIPTSHDRAV